MTTDLKYKINNGEEQTISTEDYNSKTIIDFFNLKLENQDNKIFIIDTKVIDGKTKISKILSDYSKSVINIYTPQNFRFEAKEKQILFTENLKIPEFKRKLRREFSIKQHKIKIIVDNDDQLTDILNDEKRSFYKYIKPDLTFLIEINIKSTNNSDNNNETNNGKKSLSKTLSRNDKLTKSSYKKNPDILDPKKKANSIRQKSVEIFRKPIKIKTFKANYQINKGEIRNITFTEEKGNTVYEIFSDLLPQVDEKKLIFALIDNNNQYILLESRKEINSVFPTDSIISIFTPIKFSYRNHDFEFPFQFNSTIGELKTAIKEHLQIRQTKNIFFSVRNDKNKDQKDFNPIFNNDKKHIIKFIKPNMTIDIILDEFRFILVDEVFEHEDGKNEHKAIVQLNSTAADFIEKYKIKNDLQNQNGLIYCLRFNKIRYILPDAILSTFKSEYGDDENIKIQIVSHTINKIIINKIRYNYAFCKSRTTIEEAKEIIFYNYFFGKKTVGLDDIYLSISGITFAKNEDEIKLYRENTLLLQIGYQFNNYKDNMFYFSLETTVKQAIESHKWTYLKNINTNEKLVDSSNLFSCCYKRKIDAITEIKLYFDINGYEISRVFSENTKFSKIRKMIERNQELIEKLNKKEKNSKNFIFVFNKKEIPDESAVESFQTTKSNPILILIRPTYRIHFKCNNGMSIRENFTHGTKISEISTFLFDKHKQRYKIIAKSTTLKDDYLIENYIDQQPLLLRIAPPLYYFIINGDEKTLELRESVTAVEAKLSIMINLLPNITDHHLFYLKYKDKIFNDFDILPSYRKIEVDLTPLNSTFIIILPDMSQMYFRKTKEAQNEENKITKISESSKIIEIPESESFNDLKKKIQDKCQKKEFDVEFFYLNKKIDGNLLISEIKDDDDVKKIKVNFCKKKISFVLNQYDQKVTEQESTHEFDVFLDEEINSYREKLCTEQATNISRIVITDKEGRKIKNERFEDFDSESTFFYEIYQDSLFGQFDDNFDQFNNQFLLETTIKEVREKIKQQLQAENIQIFSGNSILNNELHLYNVTEKVSIKINQKEIDDFNIKIMDTILFRKKQPALNRSFTFTSETTVGDLRIVLDDIFATEKFSIVFGNSILNDKEERLFELGNDFKVIEGIRDGKNRIEPILFEAKGRPAFIAYLNLNLKFNEIIKILLDDRLIKKAPGQVNIKLLYNGRLMNDNETISDFVLPKHKYIEKQSNNNANTENQNSNNANIENQNNDNANMENQNNNNSNIENQNDDEMKSKKTFNQTPIFICYLR